MPRIDNVTKKGRILSISIHHRPDTDPDLSWIGEYVDDSSPGDIIAVGEHEGMFIDDLPEDAALPERGRNFRYFRPGISGSEPIPDDDTYKKYALQDYERMRKYNNQYWYMMGIMATAQYVLPDSNVVQEMHSGGLWGIESDSGDDYISEVENEELYTLRDQLAKIGFGKRAIAQAYKNVQHKDD